MINKYLCFLLFSLTMIISCSPEQEVKKSDQEHDKINSYIENIDDKYIKLNGIYRITISDPTLDMDNAIEQIEDILTLSKGDTIEIIYAMSYFDNGRGELYYTNIKELAQEENLPTDEFFNNFESKTIVYGETTLLDGINIGLDGSENGTEYGIIIPFEYGYKDKYVNTIPPYTTLYFEYKIIRLKKIKQI